MSRNHAWIVTLATVASVSLTEARQFSDVRALVDFQRAADSYAFLHRQIERGLDDAPATALAQAIQSQRPAAAGNLFTTAAAAAMREALHRAMRNGCNIDLPGGAGADPVVYGSLDRTQALAPCAVAALPRLPYELEYRTAGDAIVVADMHAAMVIDVLSDPLAHATTRR